MLMAWNILSGYDHCLAIDELSLHETGLAGIVYPLALT